jgi:hypothetical protein
MLIVILLGFLWKACADLHEMFRFKPEARIEMRDLWDRVELGDSQTEFARDFAAGKYKTLKLRRWKPHKWAVTTPIEWGSGNWGLHVEFDDNQRAGALRLRTEDSVHQRERENAPADRVAPNRKRPFPREWQ